MARVEPERPGSTIGQDRSPVELLFVCVHNAGRSQMAAALADRYGVGQVVVRSAGSAPTGEVGPAVVEAMAELGIDLSTAFPKPLTDAAARAADVVVTMGCGDACPVYPGTRYVDWQLPDPAGKTLDEVRPIRDEIDRRVRALIDELLEPSRHQPSCHQDDWPSAGQDERTLSE